MSNKHFLSFVVLIVIFVCGCSKNQESAPERYPGVFICMPESEGSLKSTIHSATVEEGKSVSVGFKTGGQIKRLVANEGSYVRKGQVIGYLDEADYQLSVKQVETQYQQLTSEMKRIEEMYRHNNISQNDYEKAVAGIEQLKIQLNLARNNLAYTQLIAPISGHIVEKFMEEGEMVGAGTPVYKIVDNSSVEANVALSASAYSNRDKIIKCVGKTPATGDREIPLDIIGFIPDGDNNSLFKLRLRIPDSQKTIVPGMSMSVEILYASNLEENLQKIPSRAIFERNGKSYVWKINRKDSTLTAHEVSLVGLPDGKYSFIRGLGDQIEIVSVGVHHLSEGQKIRILGDDNYIKKAAL